METGVRRSIEEESRVSGNMREWFVTRRGAMLMAVGAALLVVVVMALMIAARAAGA
jgi:hypothetical protein